MQIGQKAKFEAEPAAIGIRCNVRPVPRRCAPIGRVLCRVRRAVNQVHDQSIFAIRETGALHPSGRSHNNIACPGSASIVAPADDAFECR